MPTGRARGLPVVACLLLIETYTLRERPTTTTHRGRRPSPVGASRPPGTSRRAPRRRSTAGDAAARAAAPLRRSGWDRRRPGQDRREVVRWARGGWRAHRRGPPGSSAPGTGGAASRRRRPPAGRSGTPPASRGCPWRVPRRSAAALRPVTRTGEGGEPGARATAPRTRSGRGTASAYAADPPVCARMGPCG